jgi:hypothetical protein
MTAKYLLKLLFAAGIGGLFGEYVAKDHERWFRLGRDAFLAYQTHRFETQMAHPRVGFAFVIGMAIFSVGVAAVYEIVGLVGERLFGLRKRLKDNRIPAGH